MKTIRPITCHLVVIGALLVRTPQAFASDDAEVEPVRFELDAPAGCVDDEEALRRDITDLGGVFRDANLDDRARTFRIEVSSRVGSNNSNKKKNNDNSSVTGRLVIRDLAFREMVRETQGSQCAEVARTLALFVATALDGRDNAAPASSPAPSTPLASVWPEPSSQLNGDTWRREVPRRRGSGGIAASVFASGLVSETWSEGIRLHGVIRAIGTTRLGLAGAVAKERRDRSTETSLDISTGTSTRVGGVIGWGAPWNDSVVGFTAEMGASFGEHRGTSLLFPPADPTSPLARRFSVSGQPTLEKTWSTISPYVAWQLVFQVPFKSSVRPIAAFGGLWVPKTNGNNGSPAATAEIGVAWQAW